MIKWLYSAVTLVAIWFATAFLSGLVWVSIGIATGVYRQGAGTSALVIGGVGVLVLGPLWHLSRRQPAVGIVLCATTAATLMNGFRMLLGYQSHGILTYNTLFDALIPLFIGASTGSMCWLAYNYMSLGVGQTAAARTAQR